MTDARLPGHWLYDPTLDALSDRAWRTFGGSLMWSVDQGTDGYLPQRSLRFLHPEGVDDATAAELVAAGRWVATPDDGYQVLEWEKSQTLAKDVEWQRERNRLKNKALRERERMRAAGQESGHLRGHVTGHAGGEARLGEERSGKDALDATTYVSGSDDKPCDVCQSRPSRVNSAGARLCRTHNPHLFRDAA